MNEMWTFSEVDAAVAGRLQPLLPAKAFDIHAHLYRLRDMADPPPALAAKGPGVVTRETWRTSLAQQVGPSRPAGALFIPYPTRGGDVEAGNAFLISQLGEGRLDRGLIVVTPQSSPEAIEQCAAHPLVCGFKPYHVFADRAQTFDAAIEEYLPQWAWQLADAQGLVITLHMVRHGALADPANQRTIRTMCAKYPNAQLILAHAARGFHAPNTIDGLPALEGLDNVWFDTAAVCEPDAIMAVIKAFGPRRLLWGSDFPVSAVRGKCVTVGDAFSWICPRRVDDHPEAPECRPILVGLESLRALCLAAQLLDLTPQDLEDIFLNNALRLLGIEKAPA